jgi:NADH:ubiquinone oxidoreductase subunit
MCLKTLLYTKFFGQLVGIDKFGNKYYQSKHLRWFNKNNRWVLYNKDNKLIANIDTIWYKWLHYMIDHIPIKIEKTYSWIIDSGVTDYDKKNITITKVVHDGSYSVWNYKNTKING